LDLISTAPSEKDARNRKNEKIKRYNACCEVGSGKSTRVLRSPCGAKLFRKKFNQKLNVANARAW